MSQLRRCSRGCHSVELSQLSASASFLPTYCVWFWHLSHFSRNVRADYQKQSSSRPRMTFNRSEEEKKENKLIQKVLFNLCACLPPSIKSLGNVDWTLEKCCRSLVCIPHLTHDDLRGSSSSAPPTCQLSIHPSLPPSLTLSPLSVSHSAATIIPHCVGRRGLLMCESVRKRGRVNRIAQRSPCAARALADACMWIQEARRLALPGRLGIYFIYRDSPYGF